MPAVNSRQAPGLDYIRKRTWSFKFPALKPFSCKAVYKLIVCTNESSFFKGFLFSLSFCKISRVMVKWRSPGFLGGGSRDVTLFPQKIGGEAIKA